MTSLSVHYVVSDLFRSHVFESKIFRGYSLVPEISLERAQGIQLGLGERIVIETAGGGGYGPVNERKPELVRYDVVNGFISAEKALSEYKIELA